MTTTTHTNPTNNTTSDNPAWLCLNDGTVYKGTSYGAPLTHNVHYGELVFTTSMTSYVEALTDPSFAGQILIFSYPLLGNYGCPAEDFPPKISFKDGVNKMLAACPAEYESGRIQVAGVVCSELCENPGNLDDSRRITMHAWLAKNGIPVITGIDTRDLIIKLRENGVMNACITDNRNTIYYGRANFLVGSVTQAIKYAPFPTDWSTGDTGMLRLLYIDCGGKFAQIRQLQRVGFSVCVQPWSFNFMRPEILEAIDAIYISSGPGDPRELHTLVQRLQEFAVSKYAPHIPLLGICLGHQMMALASGLTIIKMKYGNRGFNQPVIDNIARKFNDIHGLHIREGYTTSQNHGYCVNTTDIQHTETISWFTNLNDGSNEGLLYTGKPWFSVQFHPEACGGPLDTTWIFDMFAEYAQLKKTAIEASPETYSSHHWYAKEYLTRRNQITTPASTTIDTRVCERILILGSGGLRIGQAGEFDYSGTQAIKACRAEGKYVILINPNIATVQTTEGLADKVYFLPITPEYVEQVIREEHPDSVLLQFGGQTALNCGVAMRHVFDKYSVRVLGTPITTIETTECREAFKGALDQIGERYAPSQQVRTVEEGLDAAHAIGFPVICRAAFTLGGLGSGFANNTDELRQLLSEGFTKSDRILVEKSLRGWREIECEVVRDASNNAIMVCMMENIDPMGVHTGESMVVAPTQTLDDYTYFKLRDVALRVMSHLGVVGEANIQFALQPQNPNRTDTLGCTGELEYYIVEVNARLSRSSALASKATGYPLAYVAAKIACGYRLTDIKNMVTGNTTSAFFEPSLDYLVCKIPRWDLAKFDGVNTTVNSAMKSVGEVMAVARGFEEAFQKAMRMVNENIYGFAPNIIPWLQGDTDKAGISAECPDYRRGFMIADALFHGISVQTIHDWSQIHPWFLHKMHNIIEFYKYLSGMRIDIHPDDDIRTAIIQAKRLGFSDKCISRCLCTMEHDILSWRQQPYIKRIDTVAAEFPSRTNYLYTTYNATTHEPGIIKDSTIAEAGRESPQPPAIIVIGSGSYRIGSSVEFDWCAVNCVKTLRRKGIRAIMINYNPETVSTDFDECDTLWFEELTVERIHDIYKLENPAGIIVSMSGQIGNNIAMRLHRLGMHVLGTMPEKIDEAENRYKFSRLCDKLNIDQPRWKECRNFDEIRAFSTDVGYPVLVRPSFVLSGAGMRVIHNELDLRDYVREIDLSGLLGQSLRPVVISKFIEGAQEFDMDIVASAGDVLIYALSEHVENAGTHSGDATMILPAQNISRTVEKRILNITQRIAAALAVTGPMNIQFLIKPASDKTNDITTTSPTPLHHPESSNTTVEIMVIECNVRASRSFPFDSKTLQHNFIEIATHAITGTDIRQNINVSRMQHVGIKMPIFSFERLAGVDPILGVEMASTGEVACFGHTKYEAFLKAFRSAGFAVPSPDNGKYIILSFGRKQDKQAFIGAAKYLRNAGFQLVGSTGTAQYYQQHGIDVDDVAWSSLFNLIRTRRAQLCICTRELLPKKTSSNGYYLRRMAIDHGCALITNINQAQLLAKSMECVDNNTLIGCIDSINTHAIPIINIRRSTMTDDSPDVIETNTIKITHLLSCEDLSRAKMHAIFECAGQLKLQNLNRDPELTTYCKGSIAALVFSEPSTRTFYSFDAAMKRLGGETLALHGLQHTSTVKGETIEDTMRTVGSYADMIVYRGKQRLTRDSSLYRTLIDLRLPIINAGDGDGEHPTQALLDIFTIREELGTVNGLVITIIGDLYYGRTVHSLIKLLSLYNIAYLQLVPITDAMRLPAELVYFLRTRGIVHYTTVWNNCNDTEKRALFANTDILYATRIQKERIPEGAPIPEYHLNASILSECKEEMRIMHPLPRDGELDPALDSDPRSAYFRQMNNGMYIRMALLKIMLS